MISQRIVEALGLASPTHGVPDLVTISGRPVTVTTELSQSTLDVATKRGTALLALLDHGAAREPLHLSGGAWPLVAVSDSPWPIAGADLGLLVGSEGPADIDGLTEEQAAEHIMQFFELAFDAPAKASRGMASMLELVPFSLDSSYDAQAVLAQVVDEGRWMQLQAGTSDAVLTGIARIQGRAVGVLVSQPTVGDGILNAEACARVDHLVGWCERSGRPLVSFVDTTGVAALERIEDVVVVREAATHIRTCDVIKVAVVLGHAVGLGATILGAVGARANVVLPWPRASFALDEPTRGADHSEQRRLSSSFRAARAGDVMDILDPRETRDRIGEMLELMRGRRDYASNRRSP